MKAGDLGILERDARVLAGKLDMNLLRRHGTEVITGGNIGDLCADGLCKM